MAKLTLTDISSGFQSNTAANANNTLIETALENTLSRDGTAPNGMGADLDMNNFHILNLPAPLTDSEPARLIDVQSAIAGNPTAAIVSFTPVNNIVATNVQGAIQELDLEKASLGGSSTQTFSVGFPTDETHAARLEQVSLVQTLISSTSPDIFGANGATIRYDNTTPITTTSISNCVSSQIGSTKKLLPIVDATFSASANLVIDGEISGTFTLPANSNIEVLATAVNSFNITTDRKNNNGILVKGQLGSLALSRSDAQIEITNKDVVGHTLLSLYNDINTEESAISYQGKLSDNSIRQQTANFVRFVNDVNTVGAWNSVWGVHCVGGTLGDFTPLLAYSNNSLKLLSGATAGTPWTTMPVTNSIQIGSGSTTNAGVQIVTGLLSGWCAVGAQNVTLGTSNYALLIKNDASGVNVNANTGGSVSLTIANTAILTATSGGTVFGAPTGSFKGAGTINVAGGLYLNGTAYTNPDYVFERWATGKIEKFADKKGADTYTPMSLSEMESFTRKNLHLPGLGQQANVDLFAGSEVLLARLEEAYIYLFEQEKRISSLEKVLSSIINT